MKAPWCKELGTLVGEGKALPRQWRGPTQVHPQPLDITGKRLPSEIDTTTTCHESLLKLLTNIKGFNLKASTEFIYVYMSVTL